MSAPSRIAMAVLLGALAAVCRADSPGADEIERGRLFGALLKAHLDLRVREIPARSMFRAVSDAADIAVLVHYKSERDPLGIDPEAPITLDVEEADALLALQMIIEQCERYEPCTWQIRDGYVEVGTKQRLAAPSARERRMYAIRDLMLEPPYFSSQPAVPTLGSFFASPFRGSALSRPVEFDRSTGAARKAQEDAAREIIRGVVELLDPGNWELADNQGGASGQASEGERIASLRLWRDRFVVSAPPFLHRQLAGPPTPIPVPAAPPPITAEQHRRRLYGALAHRTVTLHCDAAPAREVIDQLRAQLGVPLIARYMDEEFADGIDPDRPVMLHAEAQPALDVLESLLGRCCAGTDECTWQLRLGFIEIGPKTRLSAPAARELRSYYIGDLTISLSPFGRKRREVLAVELVGDIVRHVEPGAWDYGQEATDVGDHDLEGDGPRIEEHDGREGVEPPPEEDRGPDVEGDDAAAAPQAPAARETQFVNPPKPAIIRYWRDLLVIHAPDYIHRQIGGPPKPIPPDAPGDPNKRAATVPSG